MPRRFWRICATFLPALLLYFPRGDAQDAFFTAQVPFRHRYDFYKSETGKTRVQLTLSVRQEAREDALVIDTSAVRLSLTARDPATGGIVKQSSQTIRRDPLEPPAARAGSVLQGEFDIDPGTYQVDLLFFEPRAHLGNRHSQTIAVPDFGKALTLSSIVVARLPADAEKPPLQNGSIALTPEPVPAFRPQETLTFAYQVRCAPSREKARSKRRIPVRDGDGRGTLIRRPPHRP
ncbi:MAG TPA: hypothetical protein VGR67_14265 [Candidatus Polarisedimenticolia bacterium]|nr:hypothetical protein [Candidatus Polarisedimenticolia bacterium]